jgi:hypothetical protein
MGIVTLTTDLGLTDHYVGLVKALIVQRAPGATLIDLSHHIARADRLHGASVIRQAWRAFNQGTVHLIGVDTLRSPDLGFVAATWGGQYFVAPDNGLLTLVHDQAPERTSDLAGITRQTGLTVFPERDILAVAVAHLAQGGPLEVLGPPVHRLYTLQALVPQMEGADLLLGHVMQVDGFGNLITNITRQMFEDARRGRSFNIMARGSKYRISKIDSLYAQDVEDLSLHADLQDGGGELLALFGSSGLLELAMRWGHASNMLHVRVTDPIRIEFR